MSGNSCRSWSKLVSTGACADSSRRDGLDGSASARDESAVVIEHEHDRNQLRHGRRVAWIVYDAAHGEVVAVPFVAEGKKLERLWRHRGRRRDNRGSRAA